MSAKDTGGGACGIDGRRLDDDTLLNLEQISSYIILNLDRISIITSYVIKFSMYIESTYHLVQQEEMMFVGVVNLMCV